MKAVQEAVAAWGDQCKGVEMKQDKFLLIFGMALVLMIPGVYAGYSGQFTDGTSSANAGGSFTTTVRVTNTTGSGSGSGTVMLSINTDYFNTTDSLSKTCSFGGGSTCDVSWTLTTPRSHYGLGYTATGTFGSDNTGSISHGTVTISTPTILSVSFTDDDADNSLTGSQAVTLTLTMQNIGSSNATAVTTLSLSGLERSSGNQTYNDTIQPSASTTHTWVVTNQNTASSPSATINITGSDPKASTITFTYSGGGSSDTGGTTGGGGGGGAGTSDKTKTKKHELVPGKGITNNTKLSDSIAKVLAKDTLSEQAKENLLTLSASIAQNTEVDRSLNSSGGKTTVTTKVKYKGEDTKNLMVYDKVPKAFASNHANITITATGAVLKIVEEDPEYLFIYPDVLKGQELSINYKVSSDLNTSILDDFVAPEFYAESIGKATITEAAACTAGEKKCTANDLQVCGSDGEWTTETCTYGCEAGACKQSLSIATAADYTVYIIVIAVIIIVAGVVVLIKRKK